MRSQQASAGSDVDPGQAAALPVWTSPEYTVISTALEMSMYAATAIEIDDD